MSFFLIFSKVMVILLLIIVGFVLTRNELITEQGKIDITNILMYVFLPCALIKAFQVPFSNQAFANGIQIILIMAVLYLISVALALVFAKFLSNSPQIRVIMVMGMVLPNVGFMGYPIIQSLLGSEFLFYAVMANISFEVISWTILVSLIIRSTGIGTNVNIFKRVLSTPPLIAIIFGFLIYLSPFTIPDPFLSAINLLGNAMTPVAMLLVGMSLANSDIKKLLFKKELYIISFIRLFLFPVVAILALKALGFTGVTLAVPAILFSMPSAGYTSILAAKFGSDGTYASEIVTLCNIISLVSIPLVLMLL